MLRDELKIGVLGRIMLLTTVLFSCQGTFNAEKEVEARALSASSRADYIRATPGEDERVPQEILERGKVLISYSDCYSCHKEETKVRGPSFSDIALRYPRNEVFIGILAQRVILGATGAWGNSVMSPHQDLSDEDARAMVSYILSVQ